MKCKNILGTSFYARDTVSVAQDLLGKTIVRFYNGAYLTGVISETEAYCCSDDPASHAYRGKTQRNAAMFGPVGHAYVYCSYGIHFCLNVVARSEHEQAGAVLIRALVPVQGITMMQQARKKTRNITDGPGKLTQALYITREHDGVNMTQAGQLCIIDQGISIPKNIIICTPRIGISVAQDIPWRFYVSIDDAC